MDTCSESGSAETTREPGVPYRTRIAVFVMGVGVFAASLYTVLYFYLSNFPTVTYEGSLYDMSAFFNCDVVAYSKLADIDGVPLGYFGAFLGVLLCLGAIFPSPNFDRTNRSLVFLNVVGVAGHGLCSLAYSRAVCLPCIGYYFFSVAVFVVIFKSGQRRGVARFLQPSLKYVTTFAVMAVLGAYGLSVFYEMSKAAQFGSGPSRVVERFFSLPEVEWPSTISPYMVVQATERFEDAPIRVVTYADLLCGDCLLLHEQMKRLSREFEGKLNVVFQFFPLDAQCNDVVDKNSHPGACDLSYIAAHDPDHFRSIYDAIFADFEAASDEAWRAKLAEKYGVEAALDDPDTKDLVYRILRTGAEYEKTSDRWEHGIRSTPTMIVNNRMLIGTFPYSHLRAIFAALIEGENYESEELHRVRKPFMEHWVMD